MKKFFGVICLVLLVFSMVSMANAGCWNWCSSNGFQVSNSIIIEGNNQTVAPEPQCYNVDCVNGTCVVEECDPDDYDIEFEVSPGFVWMSVHMFGNN
jgi:hypothetical protein